jgi:hypothetical protein
VPFTAYFDDSGTHDDTGTAPGSEIVAAAGYVGTPEAWAPFESEWNALLKTHQLRFYHSVDCAHMCAQFEGWDSDRSSALHRAFVEVITRHAIVAVGFATQTASFKELYDHTFKEQQRIPKPGYYHALMNAWRLLGIYVNSSLLVDWPPLDDQVSIVVEDSPKTQQWTMKAYAALMALPEVQRLRKHFAGPPSFRSKEGNPQIQAADVLAYEMALNLRRAYAPAPVPKPRASWNALVQHYYQESASVGLPLVQFNIFGQPPNSDAFPWALLPSRTSIFASPQEWPPR